MNEINNTHPAHMQLYRHAEKTIDQENAWRKALDQEIYTKNKTQLDENKKTKL